MSQNCTKEQLVPTIEGKVLEGSIVYSDGWKAYDGFVLNGYKHYRVYHNWHNCNGLQRVYPWVKPCKWDGILLEICEEKVNKI